MDELNQQNEHGHEFADVINDLRQRINTIDVVSDIVPPKYSGNDSPDLWLPKFNAYVAFKGYNDRQRRNLFGLFMKGNAELWFATLHDDILENWNDLVEAFLLQFHHGKPRWKLDNELDSLRQQHGESVQEYAIRVKHMCHQCQRNQDELLSRFIQGLCPSIMKFTVTNNPVDFEQACAFARRFEIIDSLSDTNGNTKDFKKTVQNNCDSSKDSVTSEDRHLTSVNSVDNIQYGQTVEQLQQTLISQQVQPQRSLTQWDEREFLNDKVSEEYIPHNYFQSDSNFQPFYPNQFECPSCDGQQHHNCNNRNRFSRSSSKHLRRKCYNCQKHGHIASQCRQKRPFHTSNSTVKHAGGIKVNTSSMLNKPSLSNMEIDDFKVSNNNMINVDIYNHKIPALIDTGATNSVICTTLLKKIPKLNRLRISKSQHRSINLPSGHQLPIIGTIVIPVRFGNRCINMPVHIIRNLHKNLIIGMDFLTKHKAVVDIASRKLSLRSALLMRANEKCLIPANSECIITARLRKNYPNGVLGITPNISSLSHLGLATARVLTKTHNNLVSVRIVNTNDKDIILRRNTRLGSFSPLPNDTELYHFDSDLHTRDRTAVNTTTTQGQDEFFSQFNLNEDDLTDQQLHDLRSILWKHRDAFVDKSGRLGYCDLIKHRIELEPNARPVSRPPYRVSPEKRNEIRRQLDNLLDQGIIKPSTSPYSSPLLLVKKPSGAGWRLVVDYRELNKQTVPIVFPLPGVTDAIDMVGSQAPKYFTTLDMTSGFWQLAINDKDSYKTAFVSLDGKFEWKTLPQGLRNSSCSFQQTMQFLFRKMLWENLVIYVDDLILFSKTFSDHLDHLEMVLTRLRSANLKLGPKKCHFAKREVKFLGHILNENGIATDPNKIQAVKTFPVPKNVKQLKSFLGLAGFYRKFIKDFSKIAGPLYDLFKKDKKFVWDDKCQQAFDTLKHALVNAPLLGYPRYGQPFILYTDASAYSVGYVLAQNQDNVEHPICYGGRSLSRGQRNYTTTEREALAVLHGLAQCDAYLRGNRFTVVTDHANLPYLFKTKTSSGRIARWVLKVQEYTFDIEHRSGLSIPHADCLSRRKYPKETYKDSDFSTSDTCTSQATQTDDVIPSVLTLEIPDNTIIPEIAHMQTNTADDSIVDIRYLYEKSDSEVALSRQNNSRNSEITSSLNNVIDVDDFDIRSEHMSKLQRADRHIKPIIAYLENGELPKEAKHAQKLIQGHANYVLLNNVLYHFWSPTGKSYKAKDCIRQLVVPKTLQLYILKRIHDDVTGGHLGTSRTLHAIRTKYYWDNLLKDVNDYVASCSHCHMRKRGRRYRSQLLPIPVNGLMDRIGFDFLGKLKTTKRGNSYILVVTEYLSKFAWAFALPNTRAETVAKVLFEDIFCVYGFPNSLLSDQGASFMSHLIKEVCRFFDITKTRSSAYHPACNGLTERMNSTLLDMLSMYILYAKL